MLDNCKIFTKIGLLLTIRNNMKSKYFSVLFLFFFVSILDNKITVEQIYNGTFRAQGMDELQSLKIKSIYSS
jgi:dipeptidyl-peptidase-4